MKRGFVLCVLLGALAATTGSAQQPDYILFNGRIVTVDDFFSVQEAVAVSGERIAAVGADAAVLDLAGPATRLIDLAGRTVIPGLIDNHNHVVRATEYWPNEARLDGVTSRARALELLAAKARSLPPGEWLMSLGGWTEDQFTDSLADFTLEELDRVAPDRPAFIQSVYSHAYVNTAWFHALDLPLERPPGSAAATQGLAADVVRDARGRATGRLDGGFPMVERAMARFPAVPEDKQSEGIQLAFAHLNSIGLTSVYDPGGVGVRDASYERIRAVHETTGLTVRIFHTLSAGVPRTPAEARVLVDKFAASRPFQGDHWLDMIGIGELWYAPFHWDGTVEPSRPSDEDMRVAREILASAARLGWPVQTHATQPQTIDHLLDVMIEVNAEHPLRHLRWSITHADNIGSAQIERARRLGINLQMRSTPAIGGRQAVLEAFGAQALDMPPLRLVHDSGISYGLGTDGTKAAQIDPFVTLWWAVTGRALNGEVISRQTLSREEALIAHTRANAFLLFQEANLGAIKPGLLADMVVLDRDYLHVPADEIKDIRPVATIVGGRMVYGSL